MNHHRNCNFIVLLNKLIDLDVYIMGKVHTTAEREKTGEPKMTSGSERGIDSTGNDLTLISVVKRKWPHKAQHCLLEALAAGGGGRKEGETRRGSVSTNVPIMDGSHGLPWHQYTRSAAWRGPARSPHSRVIIFIPAISQIEMDTYDKSVRASVGDRTF